MNFIVFPAFVCMFWKISVAEILSNDIDLSPSGILPKPVNYFTHSSTTDDTSQKSEKFQEGRFTYPAGSNLEGYGPNVLSHGFYPLKFDIGGLLLGAVVGLGALLIIPKLVHILIPDLAIYSHSYGPGAPYGRNSDFISSEFSQIISHFEKVLSENNINSSECLQKAICSYVQYSRSTSKRSSFVHGDNEVKENSFKDDMIDFLIDGSKFKLAIQNGKHGINCSVLYPKCPFTRSSIIDGVKQLISSSFIGN